MWIVYMTWSRNIISQWSHLKLSVPETSRLQFTQRRSHSSSSAKGLLVLRCGGESKSGDFLSVESALSCVLFVRVELCGFCRECPWADEDPTESSWWLVLSFDSLVSLSPSWPSCNVITWGPSAVLWDASEVLLTKSLVLFRSMVPLYLAAWWSLCLFEVGEIWLFGGGWFCGNVWLFCGSLSESKRAWEYTAVIVGVTWLPPSKLVLAWLLRQISWPYICMTLDSAFSKSCSEIEGCLLKVLQQTLGQYHRVAKQKMPQLANTFGQQLETDNRSRYVHFVQQLCWLPS